MSIMLKVEELNDRCKNTLIENLGIEFTEITPGHVVARMPVDERTIQPMKRLHGGAILALAETIGSAGSLALIDNNRFHVVGAEVSGSHVHSTLEAFVFAEANIVHQGASSHVWEIHVRDKNNLLLSVCRITNRIMPIKNIEPE